MTDSMPPPVWVDSQSALDDLIADLGSQPRIAADTESNSLHAFRERVCLMQFTTTRADYLVDPLADIDLSPLGKIFSNERIEKIFHAAEYDLICLRRDFDFKFANLFDTMQAARVLGYLAVGLDTLLREKFNIEIDKKHQKADWAARPLSPAQVDYARIDTHYLFDLRDVLEAELIAKDRLAFAREDFARACASIDLRTPSGESWERFASRKDLTLRELTILSQLCDWRAAEAERLDRPLYKVMVDDLMIALAKSGAENRVDLSAAGLSEKQIKLWGSEVLESIRSGQQAPLVGRKARAPKDEAAVRRLEKLKNWRKTLGRQLAVESDIILPKTYLAALAERPPHTLDELANVMKDTPTRVEKFGVQILDVLGGTRAN